MPSLAFTSLARARLMSLSTVVVNSFCLLNTECRLPSKLMHVDNRPEITPWQRMQDQRGLEARLRQWRLFNAGQRLLQEARCLQVRRGLEARLRQWRLFNAGQRLLQEALVAAV